MNFNRHLELTGKHAFLSASKYHWINYDEDKLDATYRTALASMKGTKLHEFGAMAIELGQKMPETGQTLNSYVNDAIGFRMTPEQVLFYSDNCFGTADAISFRKIPGTDRMILRVHDLKTGITAASMKQLYIYVAMFCLEYGHKPHEIDIELRIYQNDQVEIESTAAGTLDIDDVWHIMDRIITFDRQIDNLKEEAFG